jgi:hypothetical protein
MDSGARTNQIVSRLMSGLSGGSEPFPLIPQFHESTGPGWPADGIIRLDSARLAAYREKFLAELSPVGTAEHIVIAELARCAAYIDQARSLLAKTQPPADPLPGSFDSSGSGSLFFGPSMADSIRRAHRAGAAERLGALNSREFSRLVSTLTRLQSRRQRAPDIPFGRPSLDKLVSDFQCLRYLVAWRGNHFCCPRCGQTVAHFLPSRSCLECMACKFQNGIRMGTVMAESALPPRTWFSAILTVLSLPGVSTRELQQRLSFKREGTVRRIAKKIRAAIGDQQQTTLLVGLDRPSLEPECSVAE